MALTYIVYPAPGGGFTTKIVSQGNLTQDQVVQLVATATGFPVEQVNAIGDAFSNVIITNGRNSISCNNLWGIQYHPSSGGHATDPALLSSFSQINGNLSISLNKYGMANFASSASVERVGLQGTIIPVIFTVYGGEPKTLNHGVHSTMIVVNIDAKGGKLDPSDPNQGVSLVPTGGGVEIRLTDYGGISNKQVSVNLPTVITGDYSMIMRLKIGVSIRECSYVGPITII